MFAKINLFIILAVLACNSSLAQEPKGLPLDIPTLEKPTLSAAELGDNISSLNHYLGSYPPNIEDGEELKKVYAFWSSQVSEAEAFALLNKDSEQAYYFRSELYRQGHNMDVSGAAERAIENLNLCFASFDMPISCHTSGTYLFLSVGQELLPYAETSLTLLRSHYGTELEENVESGFVMLNLLRGDMDSAKLEIKKFLNNFPESRHSDFFRMVDEGNGKFSVVNESGPE